ncbi:lysylphosphatidylglycerol synthase transmembrane domain-containing protein [Algoriphagus sp. AK58]|uniref:lysylphosphatidylglycerol synthase transmembrane domain-containing protein n=1 Tax=Algoriphagus sp. AK58 TaxID=1406877 RepID=UPI00165062EE|nr:lysylphosphatidylglycerol synthase transmembrane domain-containing protein [Algoriphagus sp. AK58]MBC6367697.1 TIGR00374 family protein [Algoriphagus sp. AK58]
MLNPKVKQLIQVVISLGVAVWIFWFLYRDIEFSSLKAQIQSSNWFWILFSLGIAWAGYWIRGWRWALLIQKQEGEAQVSANRAYHAVMVGYLVNLLVPRAGEVARCGVLSRTNGTSIGHLIGTVIMERTIDLLFLISVILLSFFLESQLFLSLAGELVDLNSLGNKLINYLPLLLGGLAVFALFIFILFKKFRGNGLINRLQQFLRQLYSGIQSIRSVKNPIGFWISSFLIWIIYFMTMYTVSLGIQSTANLSATQVLLVMVMGSIGMVAPVQGGIGTFHALVAYILIQFGVSETDGKIFAAIIHGTQVIQVMLVGLMSWIVMVKIPAWIKPDKS